MPLQIVKATAENIGDALAELNLALKAVSDDVLARPGIAGARKAMLVISVEPDPDGGDPSGGDYMPHINWEVRRSVPPRKGHRVRGLVEDGELVVNRMEEDNPNQMTLDGADPSNVTRMDARG